MQPLSDEKCQSVDRPLACDICTVREQSICADLSNRELAKIDAIMARRNVPKGKAILAEGEPNENLFVVVRGSFRLTKFLEDGRRQVTGFLFKGDFVGVRSTEQSAYTAESLEESYVCTFPHNYLDEVAQTSPGVKDRLIARGQTEYHKAQDHIVLLGKKTAEERVVSFIAMVRDAQATPIIPLDPTAPIALPMPRQDIADYLGLRLETLSRTLSALKKKGVITELTRSSVSLA